MNQQTLWLDSGELYSEYVQLTELLAKSETQLRAIGEKGVQLLHVEENARKKSPKSYADAMRGQSHHGGYLVRRFFHWEDSADSLVKGQQKFFDAVCLYNDVKELHDLNLEEATAASVHTSAFYEQAVTDAVAAGVELNLAV